MAYTAYNPAKPVTSPDTRQVTIDAIRTNQNALRDALVSQMISGWDYSVSGGTAEQPQYMYFKNGVEWLRVTLTWGTTGGADGNVTIAVIHYSGNSGGAWDAMTPYSTVTLAYDSNANLTTTTWST